MGKKITQYTNNVSVTPDNGSLLDLSEKTGTSTYESRKWTLTAFKTWVNSWVVASSIAWSNITGKPNTIAGYGITDAIDGSGTANYVPKFSDANTLTDSQIRDNGTSVSINSAPSAGIKLNVSSNNSTGIASAMTVQGNGIDSRSQVAGALSNFGIVTFGSNSTVQNVGIESNATGGTTSTNIGITSYASGGASNYCAKLQDGTEATGKFLKSVSAQGLANWATLTTSDISTSVQSVTSSATVTATSTNDLVKITAQAEALTLANPTGTFSEGQPLMFRIKDNGTARAISYGAKFRAIGVTLPTTTVISKTLYLGVIYNSTDDTFDVLGINQQA